MHLKKILSYQSACSELTPNTGTGSGTWADTKRLCWRISVWIQLCGETMAGINTGNLWEGPDHLTMAAALKSGMPGRLEMRSTPVLSDTFSGHRSQNKVQVIWTEKVWHCTKGCQQYEDLLLPNACWFYLYLHIYYCTHMHTQRGFKTCAWRSKVKGQDSRACSLLCPCGTWGPEDGKLRSSDLAALASDLQYWSFWFPWPR